MIVRSDMDAERDAAWGKRCLPLDAEQAQGLMDAIANYDLDMHRAVDADPDAYTQDDLVAMGLKREMLLALESELHRLFCRGC
jgi:hypothetical protein